MTTLTVYFEDYRQLLWEHFQLRKTSRPYYTQSEFAQELGLRPSRLCEVLAGKDGLSLKSAQKVSIALGLKNSEAELFLAMVESRHARSPRQREMAKLKLQQLQNSRRYEQLKEDAFALIADWFHFAILELTYLKGFESDHRWIAQKLGITKDEAIMAVDRLQRLGLLISRRGKWVANEENSEVPGGVSSGAIKKFHQQILERAKRALKEQQLEQREFLCTIKSISRDGIDVAKKKIRQFEAELSRELDKNSTEKDSVYCFSFQAFELTQNDNAQSHLQGV